VQPRPSATMAEKAYVDEPLLVSVVPRAPSPVGRCSTSMKTRASYLIYSGLTQSTCEGQEALNY
jgi:hypothetical protein